jgi:predicted metal-dependent phosphoesterase TrpH
LTIGGNEIILRQFSYIQTIKQNKEARKITVDLSLLDRDKCLQQYYLLEQIADIRMMRDQLLVQEPQLRINSHSHTADASDGDLTLRELASLSYLFGIEELVVTDHNAFGFNIRNPEHVRIAAEYEQLGLKLTPGVEISCLFDFSEWGGPAEKETHITGIDPVPNAEMLARVEIIQDSRRVRARSMINDILGLGYGVASYEELAATYPNITLMHIARSVTDENGVGVNPNVFLEEHLLIGGDCYAPKVLLEVEEAIDLIHACGGRAVLAHPFATFGPSVIPHFEEAALPFVDAGIDGIEADTKRQTPEGSQRIHKFCDAHGLLALAGSDVHTLEDYYIYACNLLDLYLGTNKNAVNRNQNGRRE